MKTNEMIRIIASSKNKQEAIASLGWIYCGSSQRKLNEMIKVHSIDIGHYRKRWPREKRNCPICGNEFVVLVGSSKRQKTTCSKSCSNKLFKTGENNPNWKHGKYKVVEHKEKLGTECEICGATIGLCWDHNHKTGKYRGTLCRMCNLSLGGMKDDVVRLRNAIRYLNRTNCVVSIV